MRQLPYVVPRAQRGILNTLALIVVAIIIFGAMLFGSSRVLDATSAQPSSLPPSEAAQHAAFGTPRSFSGPNAQLYSCDHGEAGAFDPSMCGLVRDVRAEMVPQLIEALAMQSSSTSASASGSAAAHSGGEEPTGLNSDEGADGAGDGSENAGTADDGDLDGPTKPTVQLVTYTHTSPKVTATFYSSALVRRVTATCSLYQEKAPARSTAASASSDAAGISSTSVATEVAMSANPNFTPPPATPLNDNKPIHDTFGSAVPTPEPLPTHGPPNPHARTLTEDDARRFDPQRLNTGGWAACTTPAGAGVIVHDLRLDDYATARR